MWVPQTIRVMPAMPVMQVMQVAVSHASHSKYFTIETTMVTLSLKKSRTGSLELPNWRSCNIPWGNFLKAPIEETQNLRIKGLIGISSD